MTAHYQGTGLFVREFLRSPLRTASLIPSSLRLSTAMVAAVPERGHPVVVELGPGTGAFTAAIDRRLGGRGRHLAIELNERMSDYLADRFPRLDVATTAAAELPAVLAERGLAAADVVVSGLPWAAFAGPTGHRLVETIAASLSPNGSYTQFTYTATRWAPPGRRQLAQLRDAFEEVVVSRTVWRNLPPALVYSARRPRVPAPTLTLAAA